MLTEKQERFLTVLEESLGVVSLALQNTNVTRDEYEDWLENIKFSKRVYDIDETSIDYVENQLLRQIQEGNTQAITFFLRTKGKGRGYV